MTFEDFEVFLEDLGDTDLEAVKLPDDIVAISHSTTSTHFKVNAAELKYFAVVIKGFISSCEANAYQDGYDSGYDQGLSEHDWRDE